MAATQHLSGVLGYSVGESRHRQPHEVAGGRVAPEDLGGVRVNAIARASSSPNRIGSAVKPDGSPTDRARTIVGKTPMGRFGNPDELVGRWCVGCRATRRRS